MPSKFSRRRLGLAALGTAALSQAQDRPPYTGALDGFESRVDLGSFDPVLYGLRRYESAPLRMTFNAQNRKQAEAWQQRLRPKIAELIGGLPEGREPIETQTLEIREFPKYRREKLVIQSRFGVSVLIYLLTPKTGRGPRYPAMICIPGHGRGVDDNVGIDDKGRDRTDFAGYAHDFPIQVVEHGMAAIAIEPMGFGCRRDAASKKKGLGQSACEPTATTALLLGQTLLGWRVYDVIRTIDWIETRKELDPTRIGCMGISGGGTCTTFAAALEPRIRVAFISGYLNTFRHSIMAMHHCIDNYIPGILQWCEMYDVAGLIAPRPLFVESGDQDPIFPVEASKASFARVKKVYETFGIGDLTQQEVFPGKHEFHGARGLPFCAYYLGVGPRA